MIYEFYKIAKQNNQPFVLKLILFKLLVILLKYIMKVTKTNNHYYRIINGKKVRITKLTYLKYNETEKKPLSILRKPNKEYSDKKVRFDLRKNKTISFDLSEEERMDKIFFYQMIKKKNKLK